MSDTDQVADPEDVEVIEGTDENETTTLEGDGPEEGTAAESTPEDTDADAEESAAAAEQEETDDDEGEDEPDPEPKKLSRNERRRQEHERKMAEKEARIAALERQIEDLKKPADKTEDLPAPPKEDDFADFDAFEDAKAEHRAEVQRRKLLADLRAENAKSKTESTEAALAEARQERFNLAREQFNAREARQSASMPDYDKKLTAFADEMQRAGQTLPPHVVEQIFEDENGPRIMYLMATDPAYRYDLLKSNPVQAARLITAKSVRLGDIKPKTTTKAPPPKKPVSGGGTAAIDPHSMTYADYVKWRQKNS